MSIPVPSLGALVVLALAGLISCVIVLSLPLELFLALLAALTFIVQGCLRYFFEMSRAAWLPYGLCVMALLRLPFGSLREALEPIMRARGWLRFTLAALVLYVVILVAGMVLNRPSVGQTLAGLKAALPFWVITALLLVDRTRARSYPLLWKVFYAVFFLQLPLVLFQHAYMIPVRADAMTTGMDAVVGTFGGHMYAGGASATLVVFALLVMAHQVARFLRHIAGPGQMAIIAAVGMAIVLAGEVKGVFVWMPVMAVFLVRRHVRASPLRSAVVLIATLAALGLTLAAYDRLYWGRAGQRAISERIGSILSNNANPAQTNDQTGVISRAASIALWLEDGERDAARFLIGYGAGAAHMSATVGMGQVAERFAPLRVSSTAIAALLWDSGVLGLLSFSSILVGALGMAMKGANSLGVPPDDQACLDALGAVLLVFCSLLFANRALVAEPSTQLLLALAVGYTGSQWTGGTGRAMRLRSALTPDRRAAAGVSRPRVVIGTWFHDDQVGWQDFRLRIESLSRHCDVTLVVRAEHVRQQLGGVQARIVVLDAPPGRRSMLQFIWRLAGLVHAARPDLVYLLGSQLALCTFLLRGCPSALYWNEHPTHFFLGFTRRPERIALGRLMVALSFAAARRATLVTPIGEAHRDDLLAHGVAPARVELVPMGVDDRFATVRSPPAPGSSGAVTAIYAGTVSAERGRDMMIEGLAQATRQGADVRLLIVGASAEQLQYCRARGEQLGVAERLEVFGRVPGSEIPTYLSRSDLGVCAWAETTWWRFNPPTKLFEYLAAGLPVLASRIGTHTAYIRDGVNGMVFDYDAEAFANVLIRAWRERARLPVLSANAARDGQRYLWSKIEPQFLHAMWRTLDMAPPIPAPRD